jgi:hypothetical protein
VWCWRAGQQAENRLINAMDGTASNMDAFDRWISIISAIDHDDVNDKTTEDILSMKEMMGKDENLRIGSRHFNHLMLTWDDWMKKAGCFHGNPP